MKRISYIPYRDPNKRPALIIPDDRKSRVDKKFSCIKEKGITTGCLILYKRKIHVVKKIGKDGLIYFKEALNPVSPYECILINPRVDIHKR